MLFNVIKRNGTKEPFNQNKILSVYNQCKAGLNNINDDEFSNAFNLRLKNNITTSEIQNTLIQTANSLVYKDNNFNIQYSILANRFYLFQIWKDIQLLREEEYYKNSDVKKKEHIDKFGHFKNAEDWYNHLKKYIDLGLYDKRILEIPKDVLLKLYVEIKKLNVFDKNVINHFAWNNFYYMTRKFYKSYIKKYYGNPIETFDEALLMLSILGFLKEYKTHYNKEKYINDVLNFYYYLKHYLIIPATPQLLNLRTSNYNIASCYITEPYDNIESISYTNTQISLISKNAGGVGIYLGYIRPSGSIVNKTKGVANHINIWGKIINQIAVAVNQGGMRKAGITLTLPIWHKDVMEFIECRNALLEESMRMFDIFPQVSIPDFFMNYVNENKPFYLIDHYEVNLIDDTIDLHNKKGDDLYEDYKKIEQYIKDGKLHNYIKIDNARDILMHIVNQQQATGLPYIMFYDNVNNNSPFYETIRSLNLCLHPDSEILTKEYGYKKIKELDGKEVHIWNGEEWSLSSVFKTNDSYDRWFEIEFSNGEKIICTDYHRFYIYDNNYEIVKRAFELKEGDKIVKWKLPIIEGDKELEFSYEKNDRIEVFYDYDILKDKYFVPDNTYTIKSRIKWLAGLIDSDGCLLKNGNTYSLQITSINKSFLIKVKRMLETLGVSSKIVNLYDEGYRMLSNGNNGKSYYYCNKTYRLLISSYYLNHLIKLGLDKEVKRIDLSNIKIPNRNAEQFVKVISVKELKDFVSESYCFNEPKKNRGLVNGIITGNCVESFSPVKNTNPEKLKPNEWNKADIGYIHTCSLISLHLPNLYEKGILFNDVKLNELLNYLIRYMDNTMELGNYPVDEAVNHIKKYRTIGIGFIGLADLLVKKSIDDNIIYSYKYKTKGNGKQLFKLLKSIFGRISYFSIKNSVELAKERGTPENYHLTKWKDGVLLGHKKVIVDDNNNILNINELSDFFDIKDKKDIESTIKDLLKYGIRNTMLLNAPPNTSTSIYAGTTASILPVFKLINKEEQKSSSYITFPKYLSNDTILLYDEYKNFYLARDYVSIIDIVSFIQQYLDSGISFDLPINHKLVEEYNLLDEILIELGYNPNDFIDEKTGKYTISYGNLILPYIIYYANKKNIKALYYIRNIVDIGNVDSDNNVYIDKKINNIKDDKDDGCIACAN